MSRAKRVRETPEIAAGVRRQAAALGRRIGQGDPADLHELLALREVVDQALTEAVRQQHEIFSWAEIAAGLGTSRQAVQMRFGARPISRIS